MNRTKIQKVMLISPYPYETKEINEATHYPPMGLAYAASYLEEKGLICNILDANLFRLGFHELMAKIKEFNPDLIGITANIAFIREAMSISKESKNMGKYVLIGGPSSMGNTEYILNNSNADAVISGEGEVVMWNFINVINHNRDFDELRGISCIKRGAFIRNEKEEPIQDVDNIPFPAYHLLPNLGLYESRSRKHPVAPIVTSRGCPYQCSFCLSQNTGWRPRSPENVLREIEMLVNKFGVRQIDILDDNFTLDAKRAERILDMIIAKKWNLAIAFPNGLRADRLTENIVHKMKLAGVYKTGIGIESGEQEIVTRSKKGLILERVNQAVNWFRKEGIIVFGFFMFGLPGETKESMEKTIKFAKKLNPHYANFGVTVPLAGTTLYNELKDAGHLDEDTEEGIKTGYYSIKEGYYNTGNLKKEEIYEFSKKAYRDFYFRPSKIWDMVKTIKSYRELKWTMATSWPLIKGVFSAKSS